MSNNPNNAIHPSKDWRKVNSQSILNLITASHFLHDNVIPPLNTDIDTNIDTGHSIYTYIHQTPDPTNQSCATTHVSFMSVVILGGVEKSSHAQNKSPSTTEHNPKPVTP
jgi:hypothetical protein